jgi:hypothetical protein
MQAINAPIQEFLAWKRTMEVTQQSPELKLSIVVKMRALIDECALIMKRVEQEARQENNPDNK